MVSLYPDLNDPWSDEEESAGGHYAQSWSDARVRGSYHASPVQHNTPNHHGGGRGRAGAKGADFTDTVNLSDFEELYLQKTRPAHSHMRSPERQASSEASSRGVSPMEGERWKRGKELVSTGAQWLVGASWWKKAILGSVLGLLCAVVFSELQLGKATRDNFLPCSSTSRIDDRPCLTPSELRPAKALADVIATHLHNRAGQYICGVGNVSSLHISLAELKPQLPSRVTSGVIEHAFYLFLYNPHWDIRWMDTNEREITDWTHTPRDTDLLVSLRPYITYRCRLMLHLAELWLYIRGAIIVLLCIVAALCIAIYFYKRQQREKAAVFGMVGRIMDVLKYHYNKSRNKKDLLPYLAIIHVRDMLIPPSERKEKEKVWEKAVEWIASHESRVRVENRRIAGEDFQVWRWIQADPPPTEEPSSEPVNKGSWYGSVFDHYPPEITTKVAPPAGTPSLCMRLKNMFEPVRHMEEGQCHELQNAVLERCQPHGAVVHVFVDKKSPYGCVYLKMDSLKSAMGAYKALHGGWYKGKLVTAKYIPENKYHKWFPLATNMKKPLYPT